MEFQNLTKLVPGDRVAVVSPSFAAPAVWPWVYKLGCERLSEQFQLEVVEYPTTKRQGSGPERARDLEQAFFDPKIRAVIASLGGDDQVTYIRNLSADPFISNPKPFFGYSDNTHFINHLWLQGIPSYYGGGLFCQFAMQGQIDSFTMRYLREALFGGGQLELEFSPVYNDINLNWDDPENLRRERHFEPNEGWYWEGTQNASGITWGGCLESIDDLLRHEVQLPTLEQFKEVILFFETSEELPTADYVYRILRGLGGRGILSRLQGVLVGRPKAWCFDAQHTSEEKARYRAEQRQAVVKAIREYNASVPIVLNMDFGHTAPQICLPVGRCCHIDPDQRRVEIEF